MRRTANRPVSIACVCGDLGNEAEFLRLTEEAAAQKPDLVVLPEVWQGWGVDVNRARSLARMREIASKYGVYIIHTTIREEGGKSYNTSLVLGRDGQSMGQYDKVYPYWGELPPADRVWPGQAVRTFDLDFGRIAILVCFDANYPNAWESAARQGAELIIFSSAYGAGMQLAAHALNYHYPIVSATLGGYSMGFDIDGRRTVDVKSEGERFVQFYELDLDRCIFHENFNTDKLEKLLGESPRRVEVEKHWPAEQWIIVRSAKAGESARSVCAEASMEELRQYKFRSRAAIDKMRGGEIS